MVQALWRRIDDEERKRETKWKQRNRHAKGANHEIDICMGIGVSQPPPFVNTLCVPSLLLAASASLSYFFFSSFPHPFAVLAFSSLSSVFLVLFFLFFFFFFRCFSLIFPSPS